jgi:hypothetical protein
MTENPAYRIESFGRDCMGNITGYRVVTGHGPTWRCAPDGRFIGDIYIPGSFAAAYARAVDLCARLNETGIYAPDHGLRADAE